MKNEIKISRIERLKKLNGSRKDKTLKNYSDKFNKMFEFYFKIYRSGLINFCGERFKVDFDINRGDAKFSFREYDNGRFKNINPLTRHPNILYGVIVGKKGWGLWCKEYSMGISECLFTKEEIMIEFTNRSIDIPESLMDEWDNLIQKLNYEKYNKLLDELNNKLTKI